jgi:hypothetical protein
MEKCTKTVLSNQISSKLKRKFVQICSGPVPKEKLEAEEPTSLQYEL